MKKALFFGIFLILAVEIGLFLKIKFIRIFATPISWTGYLLIIDYFIFRQKKFSNIFHTPLKFLRMVLLSIVSWWMFEWFNIFISNWKYFNLVNPLWVRYIGYFWAFGTILPALIFTADLIKNTGIFRKVKIFKIKITKSFLVILLVTGFIFLLIPIISFSSNFIEYAAEKGLFFWLHYILPFSIREYLAAFVWLSFIFLLEPVIYLLKKESSILAEFEKGKVETFFSLIISGFICGFLWEFWNFWAECKWKYFVPILPQIKLFEMPILGYLGFPAFAVEMYLIYNFIEIIFNNKSRKKI